jgi:LEA14-like dessication related protein
MGLTTVARSTALTALLGLALIGCATREPLKVSLAGIAPLEGAGMETRFMARLRVQNPNETPIAYDGASVDVELNGQDFASGVSDARGEIARFGESLVEVPVTVPAFAIIRQVVGLMRGDRSKVTYRVRGFLNTAGFGRARFDSTGEIDRSKPPPERE